MDRKRQLVREASRVVDWTYTLYNMVPHGHKNEDRIVRANINANARYQRRYWAWRRAEERRVAK